MTVNIKFVGALRQIFGKTPLTINFTEGQSLLSLIAQISQDNPQMKKNLIDQQENPKPHALILVNGKEISVLAGLETTLQDGDEVVFIPITHGG
ncbi:MAG: MoaD/ThiS family protein [Candidatus Bathyarchaeota archaeon]|nr:MoaD/ThiS family protein [Candidatus Bathyarchaeota archaeon]